MTRSFVVALLLVSSACAPDRVDVLPSATDALVGGDRPADAFASDGGIAMPRVCSAATDCASGERCVGAEGCGLPSTCQRIACSRDIAQLCGCDGVTFFASSTCPDRAFAHRGPCEAPRAPNGAACSDATQCAGGRCITEREGWPGGYCTQSCGRHSDCGATERCFEGMCYATCGPEGSPGRRAPEGRGSCRDGHACFELASEHLCGPAFCTSNAECATGSSCRRAPDAPVWATTCLRD